MVKNNKVVICAALPKEKYYRKQSKKIGGKK